MLKPQQREGGSPVMQGSASQVEGTVSAGGLGRGGGQVSRGEG